MSPHFKHRLRSSVSTSVVLPLASGHCNVCIFFVPREEVGKSKAPIRLHRASQHIQLWPSRAHEIICTLKVDEEPLLEKMPGVIGQQRALANKFNTAINLKLWLSCWLALAMDFGSHSCKSRHLKLIDLKQKNMATKRITAYSSISVAHQNHADKKHPRLFSLQGLLPQLGSSGKQVWASLWQLEEQDLIQLWSLYRNISLKKSSILYVTRQ